MANHIETRDFDANRSTRSRPDERRSLLDDDVSMFSEVAEGIIERDRRRMKRELIRWISFVCAILIALCCGSIQSFSVFAPYFQSDLRYTQLRINAVSIAAELTMYLPIPFLGYLCDRYSPAPLALLGGVLFGLGYLLAAFTYKAGPPKDTGRGEGWPFGVMVVAFVAIGVATSAMYIAAIATCAKNFGKSRSAGLLLAMPIAGIGLSGMWLSQVGDRLLHRKGSKDLDVFRYFLFLGCLLLAVGIIGTLGLRVVGEEDLIDERVEQLERSGLLEESEFFRPGLSRQGTHRSYGTTDRGNGDHEQHHRDGESDQEMDLSESMLLSKQQAAELAEEERMKKNWLLNLETRSFLTDHTMWFLAAGFFLLVGPCEAYINNLGTIIGTLTPTSWAAEDPPAGAASTHVSTFAITSTAARLLTGTLSDLLAPRRQEGSSMPKITTIPPSNSSSETTTTATPENEKVSGISRLYLLFTGALFVLLCFLSLALLVPSHPSLFPMSSAFMGFGYGTSFSLTPIIVSVVWGVENFGTNWGIVALLPAAGATVWSAIYAVGYANAIQQGRDECLGQGCFDGWAWGCVGSVVVAMMLFGGAWRGWRKRDIVV